MTDGARDAAAPRDDELLELLLTEDETRIERLNEQADQAARSCPEQTGPRESEFRVDVGCPGQTAQDLLSALRSIERNQPALVSVHVRERMRRSCGRSGAHEETARRLVSMIRLICPRCRTRLSAGNQ